MEKFARRSLKRATRRGGGGIEAEDVVDRTGLVSDGPRPDAIPDGSVSDAGGASPNTDVARLGVDCIEQVFGRIRHSVLVVDVDLRVLWRNETADRFLTSKHVLGLSDGRLITTDRCELARLQRWVDRILLGAAEARCEAVTSLKAARTGRFCEIVACRGSAYGWPPDMADVPVAILFVSDPDQRASIPASVLDSLFGLTDCERRLVDGLLNGWSLHGYAAEAHIKVSTARTHLKSIFRKTDTRSQAALVSLLSRLVPPVETGGKR